MKTFTKKTIIICAAILSALISQAQTVEWVNKYDVQGSGGVEITIIAADVSGNIYSSGIFAGTGTFGSFTMTSVGVVDFYLTKSDPSGNVLWAKQFGGVPGAAGDYVSAIFVDATGIYLSGIFTGSVAMGSTTLNAASLFQQANFICKTDLSGNFLWAKKFDVERITSICSGVAGNVYAAGSFTGTATFGTFTASTSGNVDAFVAKLDALGNAVWFNKIGATGADYANNIIPDGLGDFYVGGYFTGSCTFGTFTLNSNGSNDAFIIKLNNSGTILWAKNFGGTGPDGGCLVTANSTGNIYFESSFSPPATFGTFTLTSGGTTLGQIDANGTVLWANQFGALTSGDNLFINSIASDPTGNVYSSGVLIGNAAFGTSTLTSPSFDVFISKVNSTGNFVWVKQFGGTGNESAHSVIQNGGKVYCSGAFEGTSSIDNFSVTATGSKAGFVMKISSTPIGFKENYKDINVNVYPNPVSDKLVIESDEFNQNLQVSVMDLLGKEVLNKNFINSKTETVDVSMLLPGVYFVRITSGKESGVVKIVKE